MNNRFLCEVAGLLGRVLLLLASLYIVALFVKVVWYCCCTPAGRLLVGAR